MNILPSELISLYHSLLCSAATTCMATTSHLHHMSYTDDTNTALMSDWLPSKHLSVVTTAKMQTETIPQDTCHNKPTENRPHIPHQRTNTT